jgi:hypothetical protein
VNRNLHCEGRQAESVEGRAGEPCGKVVNRDLAAPNWSW